VSAIRRRQQGVEAADEATHERRMCNPCRGDNHRNCPTSLNRNAEDFESDFECPCDAQDPYMHDRLLDAEWWIDRDLTDWGSRDWHGEWTRNEI
jgi:hypothetical protein